jgi:hypothetical protein
MRHREELVGLTFLVLGLTAATLWYLERAQKISRWVLAILLSLLGLALLVGNFYRYFYRDI